MSNCSVAEKVDKKGNPVLTFDQCISIMEEVSKQVAKEMLVHRKNQILSLQVVDLQETINEQQQELPELISKQQELYEIINEQVGPGGIDSAFPDPEELAVGNHFFEFNQGKGSHYELRVKKQKPSHIIQIRNIEDLEEQEAAFRNEAELTLA
jgi:hypothetical protein